MLLFENKEQKLISILKFIGSPFKKFVSTGEIKEDIGIVQSRYDFLEKIACVIDRNTNFILPIIGEVGQGKTHLYWALKHELYNYNIVYISLETVQKKFYYATYAEFIENLGEKPEERVEPLRNMTKQLCKEWGSEERRFGFFQIPDIDKVKQKAYKMWSGKFENREALNDVITAITAHQCDPDKKFEAERWLIGDLMDVKDLSHLKLKHDIRKRHIAFTMLKVLIENLHKETVLFIDDFERILSSRNLTYDDVEETEEIEEIFDPRWFGTKPTPENYSAEKTLDKILELQKIRGLRIIITLKSEEYFEEFKKRIERKNRKLLLLLKKPLIMSNFKEEDVIYFYKNNLDIFFANIRYNEYFRDFQTSLFPLNQFVLKFIFQEAKGNPREIIKSFIKIFNEIILSNEKLEDILDKYQSLN
ncbi:MAG: hypothetical protein ACW986_18765 [Promethearchaeota archaeon]|jgi:hypothetical protein